jgi:hypothetical protein
MATPPIPSQFTSQTTTALQLPKPSQAHGLNTTSLTMKTKSPIVAILPYPCPQQYSTNSPTQRINQAQALFQSSTNSPQITNIHHHQIPTREL